jgi:membrane-bound lytic murein transglycosylase F
MNLCRIKQIYIFLSLVLCLALTACRNSTKETDESYDLHDIKERGELRVIISQNAISYFVNDEDEMGYEYDLVRNYADYIGVDIKLIVASSAKEMKQLLLENKGDIIASQFPCSKGNKQTLAFTNCRSNSFPVLVQPSSKNQVKYVTDLIGKKVCVKKNDKYWIRLKNLNEEIGGGIIIQLMNDSLSDDALIVKVSKQEIPMTIADNDIAEVFKNNLHNINISVQVGLSQERGWAVRKNSEQLLSSVNEWFMKIQNSRFYNKLHQKYYEGKFLDKTIIQNIPKGNISPYDSWFQKYAPQIGWDWRLLAALAFNESHFDTNAVSSAGALGLMQMMPGTGAKYGLDTITIFQPEPAIAASVQYIKSLNLIYRNIDNQEERIKFILASYNAGPAHIIDAQALAVKYGEKSNQWNIVEKYLLLKSQPEYYNDDVCKFGYFRGNHTVRYIEDVFNTYNRYMGVKKVSVEAMTGSIP